MVENVESFNTLLSADPVSRFECVSGQSSHSERASAEWQISAVTHSSISFSFVSRFSKHSIEFIAIDS